MPLEPVTPADLELVEAAKAEVERLRIEDRRRIGTAEDLARAGTRFDVVLALEIVEHVADLFLDASASMVKSSGAMIPAALNRTARAFTRAIVGAEYVPGWLPRGTRGWQVRAPDCMAVTTNKHAMPRPAMDEA